MSWAIVNFGQFFEKYRSSQNLRAIFIVKVVHSFWQKMGWAMSWAIFSQTFLATLS
jgi:hypothetical protein